MCITRGTARADSERGSIESQMAGQWFIALVALQRLLHFGDPRCHVQMGAEVPAEPVFEHCESPEYVRTITTASPVLPNQPLKLSANAGTVVSERGDL